MISQLVFVFFIVSLAASLAVLSGFGFVLFSAPLLSLVLSPVETVSLTVALSTVLLGTLNLTPSVRRSINGKLAISLVLWSILGIPVGVIILPYIDKSVFRLVLGMLTIGYVVYRVFRSSPVRVNPQVGVPIAGILGGILSTSTGFSAIPVVLLLSNFSSNAYEDRATLAGYVFATGALSLLAFALAQTLSMPEPGDLLLLMPALFLGIIVGSVLIRRLRESRLIQVVLVYLVAIGVLAILAEVI